MTDTSRIRTIGRYHMLEEIGRGGMAIVYKGWDPVIGRTVALKTILFRGDHAEGQLRQRLYREACAAGTLQHPNVVTVYDVIEEGGTTAVAMEFVHGQTLAAIIAEQAPMPFDAALDLFEQVCAAIDYAGRHDIVHRDIKPANILVTADGRAKVADFGVARLGISTTTQTGTVMGSPSYMSPEQIKALPLDTRSDLFAAAVVCYEMLTGERPFAGDDVATTMFRIVHEPPTPPAKFNAAIGPELTAVFARALAKERDERYLSGAELCAELRRATSIEQVLIRDTIVQLPVQAAGGSTLVRNTLIAAGVVVLLALLVMKVTGIGGFGGEDPVSTAAAPAQPAPPAPGVQPPLPAPPAEAPAEPAAAPPLATGPVPSTSLPPVGALAPVPAPATPTPAPESPVAPPDSAAAPPAATRRLKTETAPRAEGGDRNNAPAARQATVQVTYGGDVYPVSVFSGPRAVGRLTGSADRLAIPAGRALLRVVNESIYLNRAFGTVTLAAGERRTLSLPGIVSAFIDVRGETYEGLRILIDGRAVAGSYPAQVPRLAGGPHRIVFRWSSGALEGVQLVDGIDLTNGRHFLIRAEPDAERVVVQKLR